MWPDFFFFVFVVGLGFFYQLLIARGEMFNLMHVQAR